MFTKYIKNFIAIMTIIILTYSNVFYTAIINDDDSSSFVTKKEFDTLKDSITTQVNNYNNSINGKIDTAISSYLANMNLSKPISEKILLNDWGSYTMINGSLDNDYQLPDLHATGVNYGYYESGTQHIIGWTTFYFDYIRDTHTNRRNIVDNVTFSGSTANTANTLWYGVANNMKETWSPTKYYANVNDFGWGYTSQTNNYVLWASPNTFTVNGKFAASDNIWEAWPVYVVPNQPAGNIVRDNWNVDVAFKNLSTKVDYSEDSNGNIWSYKHIGNWDNTPNWEVSQYGTNDSAFYSTISPKRSDDWFNLCTIGGILTSIETYGTTSQSVQLWKPSQATDDFAYNHPTAKNKYAPYADRLRTNKSMIPLLGLVPQLLKPNNIYQFDNNKYYKQDGSAINRLNLLEGMVLLEADEKEKIEWEPEFSNVTVDGESGQKEVYVVLSYAPFTSKKDIENTANYVDIKGYTKGVTFPKTTNRKVKIEFESDRKSLIYVKWFPADISETDLDNKFWQASLNIENCNTYKSVKY